MRPLLFTGPLKTIVYIDGFNLYYAIRGSGCKWLDLKKLALQVLPGGVVLEKIKYYTARVSGANDPGQPQRQQVYLNALKTITEVEVFFGTFLAKDQWRPLLNLPVADRVMSNGNAVHQLTSLTYAVAIDPQLPRSSIESIAVSKYPVVRQRRARPTPAKDAVKVQVFTMEEKGSDVNLAVHLVNDAWAGRFEAAAVLSNDTDLVEPIRIVTNELNKPVMLLCPSPFGASKPLAQVASSVRHIRPTHLNASLLPDPVIDRRGVPVPKPTGW